MRDSATVKELMNELFDPKASHKNGLSESAVSEALDLLKKGGVKSNSQDDLDKLFGKANGGQNNPFKVDHDYDKDFYKCAFLIKGDKLTDKIGGDDYFKCASIIKDDKIAIKGADDGVFHCAYFIKPGDKEANELFKCAHKVQLGKNDKADVFSCAYKIDKKDLAAFGDKDFSKFSKLEQ